ncbi:hypothetical protein B0H21DRAFT_773938 [Amylocystis lapponica]|nr:hypothetical protein B0H21DRAFT_773938 [Amylocystis lapponica]
MEVDTSRFYASVLNTFPLRSARSYPQAFTSEYTFPPPMPSGSYQPSSYPEQRLYPGDAASDANFYATDPTGLTHASSSRGQLPHYPTPSTSRHNGFPESWSPHALPLTHSPIPASLPPTSAIVPSARRVARPRSAGDMQHASSATMHFSHTQELPPSTSAALLPSYSRSGIAGGSQHTLASVAVPRLPPILQVEKQQVTTTATQAASASRRRNEAHFVCPVPGCGSTFTRRFNLRGHLRSHTAERPFLCEWPGCNKGFARQHDCKRHQALHASRSQPNVCQGCGKSFSRLDALNRHLRSEGGAECRQTHEVATVASRLSPGEDDWENRSNSTERSGR